jgi:phosphopentomutase
LPDDALLLVASDHGNIEDTTTEHTRNPALGLVVGPDHDRVARQLRQLQDVPRTILDVLEVVPEVKPSG